MGRALLPHPQCVLCIGLHLRKILLFIGPHAPVRHWVVGNIDGQSLSMGVDQSWSAVTVSPFKGPSPPWGSHRYGFFLFRQYQGEL